MQKIEINLASSDGASGARLYAALMFAGACLAVVYTFYNGYVYLMNKEAIEVYRQRVAAVETNLSPKKKIEPARLASTDVDIKALKKDVSVINEIIDRKSFMWTNLLTGLELSAPPDVYLIQISPDFKKSNVTVTGAARKMSDALSMVDRMGRSPYFKEVFLLSHAEEKPSAPQSFLNHTTPPFQRPGMPPMQPGAQGGIIPQPPSDGVIIFNIIARYVAGQKP